jgi:N-acylneuraminate cytidylyltransferase
MRVLIPARKNSKGFPLKNRSLFPHTAKAIPRHLADCVYVSTDDAAIADQAAAYNFHVHDRPAHLATDTAAPRDVVEDFLHDKSADMTVFLYLTYPQRTWADVVRAINELAVSGSRSLLCQFEITTSPYMFAMSLPGNKGRQVISHDLYRRQDYPACFEISHFVSVFYDDEVCRLNKNLYNDDTYFMRCEKKIDVDLPGHLSAFCRYDR